MSLVIALLLHAILGGLCAYQGRGRLEARDEQLGPPYLLAMSATCLVGAPCTVFLFHFYSAWFVHYAFNPADDARFDQLGFPLSALLMFLLAGCTTLGFLSVRYAIRRMHAPWSVAPVVLLSVVTLLFALINFTRVFMVGDHDQFLASALRPIHGHLVGAVSLIPIVAGAMAALQCGRWFKVDNQSRPPTPA